MTMTTAMRTSLGLGESHVDGDSADPLKMVAMMMEGGNVDMGDDENVEPRPPAVFETPELPSVVSSVDSDSAYDYKVARNTLHSLLGVSGTALAGVLQLANETQHPRCYSTANELIGTMRQLTQDLLNVQKAFKEIKRDGDAAEIIRGGVTNNTQVNMTVGGGEMPRTAAEMLEMLKSVGAIQPKRKIANAPDDE